MEFQKDKIEEFQQFFNNRRDRIAAFDGCLSVKLMQDASQTNIFYTLSIWKSEQHLENYRESEFFEETWIETKKLFAGKPLAYSLMDL